MALNYVNRTFKDFGGGIDQRSAPNNIPQSFCEDIQNAVPNSNGQIAKRAGYQGYYGYIPIRVDSITHDGTSISLSLDSAIDVSDVVGTPIIVYGKLSSSQSGDWSNTLNAEYYTIATSTIRTTLEAAGSPVTVTEAKHGVSSSNAFITLLDNSDNTTSTDWSLFYADRVDISSSSTYDVDIEYSTLSSDITSFVAVTDKTTVSGEAYTKADVTLTQDQTFSPSDVDTGTDVITITAHGLADGDPVKFSSTGTLPTGITAGTTYYLVSSTTDTFKISATSGGAAVDITGTGSGTHTMSAGDIVISPSDHGFTNNNILAQVFVLDSGEYYRIFPDISINSSTGAVTISVTNSDSSAIETSVRLSQADPDDAKVVEVGSGSPGGTEVTTSITVSGTWHDVQVYESSSGIYTWVMPESVEFDSSAGTLSITINNSGSAKSFYIFYEEVDLSSSVLEVTDNSATSASYTDNSPQLTLWGVSHRGLYKTSAAQEGHVTHIDSYKSTSEERVVSGLGGNLFTARTRAEVGDDYLIPSTTVDITGTIDTSEDYAMAPTFQTTGSEQTRTAGTVTADNITDHKAPVSQVEWLSGNRVRYIIELENNSGSESSLVSNSQVIIDGMANDVHNGTFTVVNSEFFTSSTLYIEVDNTNVDSGDWDETGAEGTAAVYSDQFFLASNSKFIIGDTILSGVGTLEPAVIRTSTTRVTVSGITAPTNYPINLTVFGRRTSDVIPVTSTDNFVVGDMCEVGSLGREVRILGINTNSDLSVTITGDGSTATVTTASAHGIMAGTKVTLARAAGAGNVPLDYEGTHTVLATPTEDTFTIAATSTTSTSGIVVGKTLYLDEAVTVEDGLSPTEISVVGRWIPIEAPASVDDLPASTYKRYLDSSAYTEQGILRSTIVSDNMYFTNHNDEVLKFDGDSLYQAGIFRWQPQLFAQLDTTTTSIPQSGTKATQTAAAADNKFKVTIGEEAQFTPGAVITHSGDSAVYTVQAVSDDGTDGLIYVTSSISDTTTTNGTLRLADRYSYYFRLNAIDENDNIIASAATGSGDTSLDLTASGQFKLRLVGFPVWGNYDYDKLELEVYRTKANTAGPFYRVGIKDLEFSAGDGYIDFTDGVNDDTLGVQELDSINTNLKGAELGTAWSHPLRGKYVTSADNRLILGNVKDYPELDIRVRATSGVGSVTAANMSGKIFTFRKDSTSASTTTDMTNVARYEFVTSGEVTIAPASDIANDSSSFTVTSTAHGLSAGDWVYMFHSAAGTVNSLTYAGWWQLASATTDTFTVNANMGTAAGASDVDRYVAATATSDIPVWLGTDGNLNQVGANDIDEFSAMIRLASAINSSMRMTDTSVETDFTPWMIANAGSEYQIGQLVIRQPKAESTTMEVVLPAAITGAAYYVEGQLRAAAAEVAASTRLFPSRVIMSYRNFPEIFDNPFGLESASDSVIDINPADGQEITGVIPFFGEAVFGGGQVEGVLVVFKTNSIYLVDLNTKAQSKIQSRGLGCTAPFSIASTRDGIIFANNSGIYRLNRDQSISYVGKNVERLYRDSLNREDLSKLTGHHYAVGGQYKLSVPFGASQATNNRVFVYDHQRETQAEFGAWAQYTNHNATGWANMANDEFFATTDGQVFKTRRAGDSSDYRDDADAVDTMVVLMRAEDFDNAGARKVIGNVTTQFHMRKSSISGVELLSDADLEGDFASSGTFTLTRDANDKVKTVRSTLPTKKMVYVQLKYTDSTKDEDVIISGVSYRVALLTSKGVLEQAEFS